MKKIMILSWIMLLAFCSVSFAETILQEEVTLMIEFPISGNGDLDEAGSLICEEKAKLIGSQRKKTRIQNYNTVIVHKDQKNKTARLMCSFQLSSKEGCACDSERCADGQHVNSCYADCDGGETAFCDCGSCGGIRQSSCRCY